ncbi:MAG TPA: transferase [Alphaproteobacteria bacterium]|nr:transferase [Alphaproteobacteria bacterium]
MTIEIVEFISGWGTAGFEPPGLPPWDVTARAAALIAAALPKLDGGYRITGEQAIHATATIEPGATLKGSLIIGPRVLVATGAYLRGGVFLGADCVVGPGCEVKTSFLFEGAKIAHLSFVGDSILGARVNVEAGAIIANYRNELDDKRIRIRHGGGVIDTGCEKFGALVGDDARIGANAVIAPGALIARGARVPRLGLVDQHPDFRG